MVISVQKVWIRSAQHAAWSSTALLGSPDPVPSSMRTAEAFFFTCHVVLLINIPIKSIAIIVPETSRSDRQSNKDDGVPCLFNILVQNPEN